MESCGTGWGKDLYKLIRILVKRPCKGYYIRWYYNGWHYWFFLPGSISEITEGENYRTIGTRKLSMGSGQITLGQCGAIRTIFNSREISMLTSAGWMNIRIEPGSGVVYDHQIAGTEIEFIAIIGSKELSPTGFTPVPGDGFIPDVTLPPPVPVICEVIIGTQIWMCKNYDSNYPGSKVYDDDEVNRAIYGGLYTYNQIIASGFCPAGWHVPTLAEWTVLTTYLGGEGVAGGKLKELGFLHWNAPNTGASNSSGFTAVGAGYFTSYYGALDILNVLWTADAFDESNGHAVELWHDSAYITPFHFFKHFFYSVRLIKDVVFHYLKDIDGNVYTTVIIGTQEWIVENLRVTKYADGTPIPNVTVNADWIAEDGTAGHDGAYCWYNNDPVTNIDYGPLYNNYAVTNPKGLAYFERGGVQEAGWRCPTKNDFDVLAASLGATAGGRLKEAGLTHWVGLNPGAHDTGFNARGAGLRNDLPNFTQLTQYCYLWGTTENGGDPSRAYEREIEYDTENLVIELGWPKINGCSVRCVRDL